MTTFFYNDYEYTTDDLSPVVNALIGNPSELASYQEKMLKLCDILLARQAYASALEAFAVMCRVLAEVQQALGQ